MDHERMVDKNIFKWKSLQYTRLSPTYCTAISCDISMKHCSLGYVGWGVKLYLFTYWLIEI